MGIIARLCDVDVNVGYLGYFLNDHSKPPYSPAHSVDWDPHPLEPQLQLCRLLALDHINLDYGKAHEKAYQ